jgi:hypothetical protein
MMSSEPTVGYKRSAPDAPDTSDDDGSQPERGKESEAAVWGFSLTSGLNTSQRQVDKEYWIT